MVEFVLLGKKYRYWSSIKTLNPSFSFISSNQDIAEYHRHHVTASYFNLECSTNYLAENSGCGFFSFSFQLTALKRVLDNGRKRET